MTDNRQSMPNARNISRTELDNGITLLVYENRAVASVNITGSLHAGSIYDKLELGGLAAFAGAALLTGTQQRDFDELHGALEDIGAELSFRSHAHKLGVVGKSLAEDLPQLLATASEALRQPIFPAEHVERLRGERLTWLQYSAFDTRYRAAKAMRQSLYPAPHPYHYGTYGEAESLSRISRDNLRDFHAGHYGPAGMILVIVGNVRAESAIQLVKDAFGDWRNPQQAPLRSVGMPAASETERQTVFVPGKTQSDISMGATGPPRSASDFLAAQLANSVLGEFGMMGRIGKNVRERKGLAYYAYSQLGGGHGPDPWVVSAGVSPDNVDLAIDSMLDEIDLLVSEPVSADDLADNQSYFTGRLPLRLESNEGISANIHSMESFGLGLDYLLRYRDMIYDISAEDMLRAAKRYLDPQRMVIAVAGPESESEPT